MRKYQRPAFLIAEKVSQEDYERWLYRRAKSHVKRDKKRGRETNGEKYKLAIHQAVEQSQGKDAYTGEPLDWNLLSSYVNEESKMEKSQYKKRFALLPSVDHFNDQTDPVEFKICAWRTNDAKNDLSHQEFVDLCRKVINLSTAL